MMKLLHFDVGRAKLHYPSSFWPKKTPVSSFPRKLSFLHQLKLPILKAKSPSLNAVKNSGKNVSVQEKEETETSNFGKVVIDGKVILKKKTIPGFKERFKTSILGFDDALVGKKVSFQLVSAVNVDPANADQTITEISTRQMFMCFQASAILTEELLCFSATLKGKLGNRSYLEELAEDSTGLAHGEYAYNVKFDWDEDIALPGAVIVRNEHDKEFYLRTITLQNVPGHGNIHFVCNSWVYPARCYEKDRIFFTNETYLPHKTPAPLREYREEELEILRGKGRENKTLMKWERVYDYAYYNDLGNPEKGPEYVRHVLGGSKEYPYPRRGRTSRPPTSTDPETETRLSLLKGRDIYIPRDEKFGHIKLSDFFGDTVKSLTQGIFGMLDSVFDLTPKEFDSLNDVMDMHEGLITLPDSPSLNKLRRKVPTKFLKALFRSDGAALMNYPMPDIVKVDRTAWRTDEEFARQMLAGIHPLMIRRLEKFPPISKLDPEVFGNQNSSITKECIKANLDGLSVEEAIASNRLYILDHHDTVMPFLKDINTKTTSRVYATRTLLFLRKDGTLKPLVIELSLPKSEGDQRGAISKLYTPATEGVEASLWWLAKTYVTINDAAYHQLISHWLHTHAVIEPFIIAANRQLSKLHPIHKLLHPHFRDTMPVNTIARQIAMNAKGLFEQAVYTRQYVGEWTSALYKDWKLTDHALPRDLMNRGMAVKDGDNGYKLLIEDYPYAVDGLEIWSAIETWVKTYCSFYYKSDDMVANDPELQSWWTEIREVGHGDKKDETWWPKMMTLDELIETCTTIIWVASALHAVLNFGQYPYGGYMPNRPTISRKFMPEPNEYDKLEKDPERVFLETVTSQLRTMVCISVIELISRHSEDEVYLGQREAGWTSDEVPIKALEEFNMKLDEIEAKILERNRNPEFKNRVGPAMLPFTLLCRSSEVGITGRGIPNSVSL
ncbi:putative linoleate 9S-lipoxygenase 5 [Bienertia sinuspersici]